LHFFTQKQETQQHYQLRTKTYYLILKEKILLKIKNPTQKILSIWNFNIIRKMFVVSSSDCRLLKRRQYFLQICFIVNYFRARIVLRPFLSYDSNQLQTRAFHMFMNVFYITFICLLPHTGKHVFQTMVKYISCRSRWTATLLLRRSKSISCRSLIVDRPLFQALLIKGNSYTQLCLTLWCGMFVFGKRWCNLWLLSDNVDRKSESPKFWRRVDICIYFTYDTVYCKLWIIFVCL
jgi:hypothetical protein